MIGFVGENGSGKSTMLKIITGVLTPTSGSMVINGKISALLELGSGFNPEYSGYENIFLNGMVLGFPEKRWKSVSKMSLILLTSAIICINQLKRTLVVCLSAWLCGSH